MGEIELYMCTKKSERLLLRMNEAMAAEVRTNAERHYRAIQDEIRWLIACGLKHAAEKETKGERRQQPSTGGNQS